MHAKIKKHFQEVDPILFSVLRKIPDITISPSDDYFVALCESIVSQQLSVKAGGTIWKRFEALVKPVTPENILNIADAKIRECGISWSKISYLKNLAKSDIRYNELPNRSDVDVMTQLTKVKGIGPWTAEMFLMFTLGREDVFSHGDAGLQRAIAKLYGKRNMENTIKKWSPYRTYAARILWESLELS